MTPGDPSSEFERPLFDDPEDREAWAVYADWLGARGDPRGELIALELDVEATIASGRRPAARVAARYAELARAGPRRWAAPSLVDADEALAIEWRRGAPYVGRIVTPSTRAAVDRLERLRRAGAGRFLVELHVGLQLARDDHGWLPASLWSGAFPSLRVLELDAHATLGRRDPVVDLRFDWTAALPRLRALSLRSPGIRCGALAHPNLRDLVVSMRGGFELALIDRLRGARFPRLERLILWLGRIADVGRERAIRSFDQVVDNPELGPVRELGLNACPLPPMSLAHLAGSALARGLERLELAWGTIGDEHLPALRALIAAAPRLRELDLTRNYLSSTAIDELRSSFPGRLRAESQKPEGDRQLPVFGRYGVLDGGR